MPRVLVLTYLLLLSTLHAPPPAGFEEQALGRESLARSRLLGPRWIAPLRVYAPEPFRSIQDVFAVGP